MPRVRRPFALCIGLAGCGGESGDGAALGDTRAPSGTTAAATALTPEAEAQQIFSTRCAVCHGAEGRGDGPGASALTPKPRDYRDQEWQGSVTDQDIERTIVYGGAAVGKSPSMVANPDLGSRPAVVAALRELIRDFGGQE